MEGQITAYFNQLLQKEKIDGQVRAQLNEVVQQFASFFAKHLENIEKVSPGGSYFKNLELKRKYDLDILVVLQPKMSNGIKNKISLKQHFFTVKSLLKLNQAELGLENIRLKRSAIGCDYKYHERLLPLDFIPTQATEEEHSYIYDKHSGRGVRTNLELQKRKIDELAARDVLKLLKCWKLKNKIHVPSYVMEIIGCEILETTPLQGFRNRPLYDTMTDVFVQIKSTIQTRKIIDMGNSNNHIDQNWRGFPRLRTKMFLVASQTYDALKNKQLAEIQELFE